MALPGSRGRTRQLTALQNNRCTRLVCRLHPSDGYGGHCIGHPRGNALPAFTSSGEKRLQYSITFGKLITPGMQRQIGKSGIHFALHYMPGAYTYPVRAFNLLTRQPLFFGDKDI